MTDIPLNIFQKLMRRWDAVHPYNAAQLMKLEGTPDPDAWRSAWHSTLSQTGLGAVSMGKDRYRFVPLNGHLAAYNVQFPTGDVNSFISTQMNLPFTDSHEPPFRPFIFQQDQHFYAGMIYQHWLADSASIRMLMREWFVRVYDPRAADPHPIEVATVGYWRSIGPDRGGWTVAQSVLDMTRRHIRMRRVQKIASTALDDYTIAFQLLPTTPGLIDRVRSAARCRGVKVNDIFLAALTEACALHVPLQPRKNRTDIAVGAVVDLRPWCPEHFTDVFGLFLGFTNVISKPTEFGNFDRLLACVANQTRLQKSTGVAPASLMWMTGALWLGKLSKPNELYHFYRKELPLAGGISNVDLTRSWMADYHPAPLLDYIRVSPTGPMTPVALTTTTLGDQFHIGITHRTGLISSARANDIASTFLSRLESL
jgi:NRPS condensation-like uncharacterized protein